MATSPAIEAPRGTSPVAAPSPAPPADLPRGAPRGERPSRSPGPRATLITEISALEQVFASTPRSSPGRVTLARRLAEAYVELEGASSTDKRSAELERDSLRSRSAEAAALKQAQASRSEQVALAARGKAIKYYTLIKDEYPDYAQLDEVLYYLAYEHEQANDHAEARKVYMELKAKRPLSRYIPDVYLAFGERWFEEAQGDPSKMDLAAQAYEQVLGFPPPGNKVYGYACYKLAFIHWNKGEHEKALAAFKKTIDFGIQFAELPGAASLASAARRDIVPVYALKGDPARAYAFFRPLSGDPPSSNQRTFKMMDDLGQSYWDAARYPEALTVYRDLAARDSAGVCAHGVRVDLTSSAIKTGSAPSGADLARALGACPPRP